MDADPQVEAALVAVRVPAHYVLSKNALEAGKHVYCEWPLGTNTKEAEELAALARKMKLRTMVGLQRRASPAYHAHARAGEGRLRRAGAVGEHDACMGSGVLTRTSDRTWQRDVTPRREHAHHHVRPRDRRAVHGGRRADRSVGHRQHAGAAVVRDRHEEVRGRDLARQHHDPGPARERRDRQRQRRRPSVPRQRLPLRDLRQGRHADDDRRRRGRARKRTARSWAARRTTRRCRSCPCRTG